MLENDVKLNAKDVKDFLRNVRDLKRNFNKNSFGCQLKERFIHYIECFILFLKYNCFDFNLKPSVIFNYFTDLNSDEYLLATQFEENNCSSFLIMLFLDLIYFIYSNLEDDLLKNKLENRIIYLFALATYSSQLDCRKKVVQTWFHKLADKNLLIERIFNESLSSPWSLQMLCRCTIKKKIFNINSILNEQKLKNTMNIPNICIKYLEFDYV